MIEVIKCGIGLCKKPRMSEISNSDILSKFDPLRPGLICNEDETMEERVYKVPGFIIHTLKRKDGGDLVLYNSFIDAIRYIEKADPNLIKTINLKSGQLLFAYESFDTDQDDLYFENFILELIRLSSFMDTSTKFIDGTEKGIIHFLKDYIKLYINVKN